MALLSSKGSLPEGAIRLSKAEALEYQSNQIKKWPNWIDVWPFKIGLPILVGLGAITSFRINNAIRSKLHLQNYGKLLSDYTVGFATIAVTGFSHQTYIAEKIMVYEAICPICIESKAILLQLGGCVLYPSILSTVANFVLANKYATYRIPHFTDGMGIIQLYLKFALSLKKKILPYVIWNVVTAGFVTYSENKSLITIRTKLLEQTAKIDEADIEPSKKIPNESE